MLKIGSTSDWPKNSRIIFMYVVFMYLVYNTRGNIFMFKKINIHVWIFF